MVTKISNGINFELDTLADNYGVENDFIFILSTNGNRYATYAGNDVVDGSKAAFSQFITEISAGLGDDHVHGTGGQDWVYDGLGNDVIMLGAGNDRMFVDGGNDIYYGGAGTDTADFRYFNVVGPTLTSDTNDFGVAYDLSLASVQNLGMLGFDQFFGFENAWGSAGTDKLYGNAGANQLDGNDGNDVLNGRGGNDTLVGGMGIDYLIGGGGTDQIDLSSLVAARDFVRFADVADSGLTAATMDVITGFQKGVAVTADRIDLALLDGDSNTAGDQALTWRGTGAFASAQGEVRYVVVGSDTVVYVDTDADAAAEMAFTVKGVAGLAATDFLL